jgi:hypothetical protein
VLLRPGATEVLEAAGFLRRAEGDEFMTLGAGDAERLNHALEAVTALYERARELAFILKSLPSIAETGGLKSRVWSPASAPEDFVVGVLNTIHRAVDYDPAAMQTDAGLTAATSAVALLHQVRQTCCTRFVSLAVYASACSSTLWNTEPPPSPGPTRRWWAQSQRSRAPAEAWAVRRAGSPRPDRMHLPPTARHVR